MPTRVVVPERLGTSKALQQGVRRQHHFLDSFDPISSPRMRTRHRRNVLHDPLSRLRLARSTLARDDDALVVLVRDHVVVGALGDRVDVRSDFEAVLAAVRVEDFVGVDGEEAEGVDGDEDVPDVGLCVGSVRSPLRRRQGRRT